MINLEKNARREQLLQTGLDIVAKDGWADLNVLRVAELSGVSSRTVQRFFSGRRALAAGVVSFARSKGYKEIAKSGKDLGY